jgi:hypothetical protein
VTVTASTYDLSEHRNNGVPPIMHSMTEEKEWAPEH